MKIVDAFNTQNPCLNVLVEMGFEVVLVAGDTDARLGDWRATRDDVQIAAEDPIRLLGLAFLALSRGERWRREGDLDLHQKLVDDAYPDE